MNEIDASFSSRLRALRKTSGFSQSQLAERLGLAQASLSRLEAGKRSALLPEVFALASIFQIPVAQLLGLSDTEKQRRFIPRVPAASQEEAFSFLSAHGIRFLGRPVMPAILKPSLESCVLACLEHALEPRLFSALCRLLKLRGEQLDWPALTEAAVAAGRQNRLGAALAAVLQVSRSSVLEAALKNLEAWRLDSVETLGPLPRSGEGRQLLSQRTPNWLKAWHFIGAPSLAEA